MYKSLLAFYVLPAVFAQFNFSQLDNVTLAFYEAGIVPQVLPAFAPADLVDITFTDSITGSVINSTTGSLLTEQQTANKPIYSFTSDDTAIAATRNYVVALVDPDVPAPQNTSLGQFLHFLGGNFTIDTNSSSPAILTNNSAAFLDYVPPAPPAGSSPHRFVLAVYVQPCDFNTTGPQLINASTSRFNFNLTRFAARAGFGLPVAGNYFLVGPPNSTTAT